MQRGLTASCRSSARMLRSSADRFTDFLAPLRRSEWIDFSKKPFGEPLAVLAYLARYTHRVANSRQ